MEPGSAGRGAWAESCEISRCVTAPATFTSTGRKLTLPRANVSRSGAWEGLTSKTTLLPSSEMNVTAPPPAAGCVPISMAQMPCAISWRVAAGIRASTAPWDAESTATLPSTASPSCSMANPWTNGAVPAPESSRLPAAPSEGAVS